jgi:hypothetical protein
MPRSPQLLRCTRILGALLVLASYAVMPVRLHAQSVPPSGTWQDKRPAAKGGSWNPAGIETAKKDATSAQQSNTGNSGRITGDGLELEWTVTGADVGPRFFADRTWQANGVVTSATVRFSGVMRASVPKGFVTNSSMSAYISLGMGANKKEAKWGGELGAEKGLSHEMPFDLTLEAPPGGTVLVSASVNKVGGASDLLGVFFQFSPGPKVQADAPSPPVQKDASAPVPQTNTAAAPPKSRCTGACLASRDVCLKALETWKPQIAQLDSVIPEQKRQLKTWWAEHRGGTEEDVHWIGRMFRFITGSDTVQFPPIGATVNVNLGERECLVDLVSECRAEIARVEQLSGGSPAPSDRAAPDYRAAFDDFAMRFASVAQTRSDEKWRMAEQRKASFKAEPKQLEFAAETNYYAGYSTSCKRAAETLRGLRTSGG